MPSKYSHNVVLAQYSSRGLINLPNDEHVRYIRDSRSFDRSTYQRSANDRPRSVSTSSAHTSFPDGSYILRHNRESGLELPRKQIPARRFIIDNSTYNSEQSSREQLGGYVSQSTQTSRNKPSMEVLHETTHKQASGNVQQRSDQVISEHSVAPRIDAVTPIVQHSPVAADARNQHPNSQNSIIDLPTPPSSVGRPQTITRNRREHLNPPPSEQTLVITETDSHTAAPRANVQNQVRQQASPRSVQTQIHRPMAAETTSMNGSAYRWRPVPPPTTLPANIEDIYDARDPEDLEDLEDLDDLSSLSSFSGDSDNYGIQPSSGQHNLSPSTELEPLSPAGSIFSRAAVLDSILFEQPRAKTLAARGPTTSQRLPMATNVHQSIEEDSDSADLAFPPDISRSPRMYSDSHSMTSNNSRPQPKSHISRVDKSSTNRTSLHPQSIGSTAEAEGNPPNTHRTSLLPQSKASPSDSLRNPSTTKRTSHRSQPKPIPPDSNTLPSKINTTRPISSAPAPQPGLTTPNNYPSPPPPPPPPHPAAYTLATLQNNLQSPAASPPRLQRPPSKSPPPTSASAAPFPTIPTRLNVSGNGIKTSTKNIGRDFSTITTTTTTTTPRNLDGRTGNSSEGKSRGLRFWRKLRA